MPESIPAAVNKDTVLCISLAARPSNIGTGFHNYLYAQLGLNYVYKAFAPVNLVDAVRGIRGLPIRGAAVSMPYKEAVIELVDRMDPSAEAIASVNTIVNDDGVLTAYNTDYLAIERLLADHAVPVSLTVLVQGAGGMAKAVVAALRDAGFGDVTVVARNEVAGKALAAQYGFRWVPAVGELRAEMIVNVTPLGMQGADAEVLAFAPEVVAAASVVFDVVALPAETPLIRAGRSAGKKVITGAEVIAIQAEEQFVLYTGVRPTAEQVREASEYSRS
ncbi:shikimate 5-dehydrogenase [Psychromicrobium xiongbiense]|uniref:shikimate 5-dehydrogenase n=1 Tax=Psychromicrobium xiongbiense TaxID=3051184 RepID=UPI0025576306|nr:shikimate 5-dehydrogenase [Psychromicrobium sp. YIM S02556]